jgi:hypothetical protein
MPGNDTHPVVLPSRCLFVTGLCVHIVTHQAGSSVM